MFSSVTVGRSSAKPGAVDVAIFGHFKGARLDAHTKKHDEDGLIAEALKLPEATGDAGRIVEVAGAGGRGAPKRVMLVGLGPKASFSHEAMRLVSAAIGKRLAAIKAKKAWVDLDGPIGALAGKSKNDLGGFGTAFGESMGLMTWSRAQFKGSATPEEDREKLALTFHAKRFGEGLAHGVALAESANVARTLSETPPNICTPMWVAAEARKIARKTGMTCTVYKGKQLLDNGLMGIHTVGQASENEPCMIRLEYKPSRAGRGAKPAVLVGKTMTYDSGGLSIKTGGFMRGMKRDMDGGAGVLGAMHAIASVIKPSRPVVALLCVAENAISDEAYRPDDIYEFRNGVTVEVTNTDAEGRLVLADGLCWACAEEDPAFIVDMATLTGGVVTALGSTYAGMWCDDDSLRGKIEAAAERTGERVWRLPLHKEYRDLMRSDVADILNSAPVRAAHPIQGAAFLSYFVEDGIPWCHLDIAGVHSVDGEKGPYMKSSATGFGARLLATLLDD